MVIFSANILVETLQNATKRQIEPQITCKTRDKGWTPKDNKHYSDSSWVESRNWLTLWRVKDILYLK